MDPMTICLNVTSMKASSRWEQFLAPIGWGKRVGEGESAVTYFAIALVVCLPMDTIFDYTDRVKCVRVCWKQRIINTGEGNEWGKFENIDSVRFLLYLSFKESNSISKWIQNESKLDFSRWHSEGEIAKVPITYQISFHSFSHSGYTIGRRLFFPQW